MPLMKRKIKIWDSEKWGWRFIQVKNDPNKLVTLEGGGPTDEGYYWWREQYLIENGKIYLYRVTESRDCDGPQSSEWEGWSEIPTRKEGYRPQWRQTSSWRRDVFAEEMGVLIWNQKMPD